jgi:excisionase family DNA binding protein
MEHENTNERVVTVIEAADHLRLSKAMVYRLLEQGELPCIRIGRAVRFRVSSLNRWLDQRETRPV